MKEPKQVTNPTKRELLTLRILIALGFVFMLFFLYVLLDKNIIYNRWLYWPLMVSFIFLCLKTLHEWYHYLFIQVPKTPPEEKKYTVDIFTTFCAGEPYEMIEETLAAIQKINYPHTTYLCDEANDPYLKKYCESIGVKHVTRTVKVDAKAGNINNALKASSGELCVILDPDHVPHPNFLDPIVTHFNDPKIGFVQIVQAYKNGDEGLIAKGAAQQTYQFYGPMMMTMNQYGTVLAIGANCTFRREALQSIGGHAAGLAEDMNTAMHLHAKGWKSVYVPQILAEGLVPSTLSAYYKQQLKWARGVFELLVTTYVKEFKNFTLLQKIHYGSIPLYYMSGLIFLINFLIPVLSLFFGVLPIKLGLQTFLVVGFPLGAFMLLIRHYVQKWVTKEEERGFHVVGGLLAIGTWWIFILGLIYTIIRKKVPYVPTPKDGNEDNNWPLQVPNIIMLVITITAIIYGLYRDWNPFMLFMAGLALLNCFILTFNILAGWQHRFRKLRAKHNLLNVSLQKIAKEKGLFWLFRRRIYKLFRSYPAIILTIILIGVFYPLYLRNQSNTEAHLPETKEIFMMPGIYAPVKNDGLTVLSTFQNDSHNDISTQPRIISLYIPWGDSAISRVPKEKTDSILQLNATPLITWEPWENLFVNADKATLNKNIFKKITNGNFDQYIRDFALQIKVLQRPVFLRFAHEFDNPQYPWSATGGNDTTDFRNAWIYVRRKFSEENADNAIWVWSPWKAANAEAYFPGESQVDWIGVDILNYRSYNPDKKSYSFKQLYTPFKKLSQFNTDIPVMVAEMGSLGTADEKKAWFEDAFSDIRKHFHQIKAFVIFNSAVDRNLPVPAEGSLLNWSLPEKTVNDLISHNSVQPKPAFLNEPKAMQEAQRNFVSLPGSIKGVNYNRTLRWQSNYAPVLKTDILHDFEEMKASGINTIKIIEPGMYQRNIFSAARDHNLNIIYSFWIPEKSEHGQNSLNLQKIKRDIVRAVRKLKNNKQIIAWNLSNHVYDKLRYQYNRPYLKDEQDAYLRFLSDLTAEIKRIDLRRPVSADFYVDNSFAASVDEIYARIPSMDYIGLIVDLKSTGIEKIKSLKVPYYFSSINTNIYLKEHSDYRNTNTFIADWKDQEQWHYVTFNGLHDILGNRKQEFIALQNLWNGKPMPAFTLPYVKILKPSVTNFPGRFSYYSATILTPKGWQLAIFNPGKAMYQWFLVENDRAGEGVSMEKLGEGPAINVNIPRDADRYSIYLITSQNGISTTERTSLNLPLIAPPGP